MVPLEHEGGACTRGELPDISGPCRRFYGTGVVKDQSEADPETRPCTECHFYWVSEGKTLHRCISPVGTVELDEEELDRGTCATFRPKMKAVHDG